MNLEEVRARGRCKILGQWRNGAVKCIEQASDGCT